MYTYMKERKKIGITFFLCIFFCARLFLKVLLIPLIWHKYSSSFLYKMVSFKVSKTCNEWKLEKNSSCHVGKCKFRFSPYLLILTRGGTHRLQYSSHVGNHHSSSSHRDGHSTQTKVHSIPGCPTVKDTIPCLGCTLGLKFKKDSRYIL